MKCLVLILSLRGKKIANLHHFSTVGLVEGLSIVCHSGGFYSVKSLTVAT